MVGIKILTIFCSAVFMCIQLTAQTDAQLAQEKTAPFDAMDFKGDDVYVTVDNETYKWLKLGTIEVSTILEAFQDNFSGDWQKRMSEDLVEYLHKLEIYPKQRDRFTVEDVNGNVKSLDLEFTREKRSRSKEHYESTYDRRIDLDQVLSREQALEDIDQLESFIQKRYAYAFLNDLNVADEIQALKASISTDITTDELALRIGQFVNKFGDGHTRIHNVRFTRLGVLPFSTKAHNGKVVCMKDGELLDEDHPYLHSINDIEVARLLELADQYLTSNASSQFKELVKVSRLNRIGQLLKLAGAPYDKLQIKLASESGQIKSITEEMGQAKRREREEPFEVKQMDDIGYLKIRSMVRIRDEDEFMEMLQPLEQSKGIIIDVRNNGGGMRDILMQLAPHFINKEQAFVIGNTARLRTNNITKNYDLSDRYLYQMNDDHFNEIERQRLKEFQNKFSPNVAVDETLYSPNYYLYIAAHEEAKFADIPVVILMNEVCFSATDIFLSTFKEIDGVTLLGTASGGGSGRSIPYTLDHSFIKVRLSSMVSYQPNGDLYDGVGVKPDMVVDPSGMSDLLKETDSQLEAAIEYFEK